MEDTRALIRSKVAMRIGIFLFALLSGPVLAQPSQDLQVGFSSSNSWFTNPVDSLVTSLTWLFNSMSTTPLNCTASDIASVIPEGASVRSVTQIPQGGTYGEDAKANPEFPGNGTELPELCAVWVDVVSSPTSNYSFGLFLPTEWNQRFIAVGNGGFGGGVDWPGLGTLSRYGFAAMSTDTGHISDTRDGSWALNHPEAIIDWGYRAMHGSVVLAKQITNAYYASKHKYAYYTGCSTGGRQGLKEVQMYPGDFDGVLSGAPAWWTSRLQPWSVKVAQYNLPVTAPHHIPPALMTGAVHKEIMRQCDPQDGLIDGIISDPYGCHFFPEALLCTPSSRKSSCLKPAQLDTLYHLYSDWIDVNQTFVFPHVALGSELENGWLFNPGNEPSALGTSWLQHFLFNDTAYDWHHFDYTAIPFADAANPGQANANNFDLSRFSGKGGKLLQHHGLADGAIPAGSSIYFYKRVLQTLAAKGIVLDDFYRFFLVPGMSHCRGSVGDAPWVVGAWGQQLSKTSHSVPGFEDADHDMLLALMRWVEEGKAPDSVIATKFKNDKIEEGVARQRPLCPYPRQAKYTGNGDPNEASSWTCQHLY